MLPQRRAQLPATARSSAIGDHLNHLRQLGRRPARSWWKREEAREPLREGPFKAADGKLEQPARGELPCQFIRAGLVGHKQRSIFDLLVVRQAARATPIAHATVRTCKQQRGESADCQACCIALAELSAFRPA